jgi:hypothetical protein
VNGQHKVMCGDEKGGGRVDVIDVREKRGLRAAVSLWVVKVVQDQSGRHQDYSEIELGV